MTPIEAKEILVKHSELFEQAEINKSLPDASHASVQEIWGAFNLLNPQYKMDWCCGSCVFNMIKSADRIRKEYLKERKEPVKMTFPKQ